MQSISRDHVNEQMLEMVLIDVLDEDSFREFHLPGAINIPLADDFETRVRALVPNRSEPVVVYCANATSDVSPQAARRLDELGYEKVFVYIAGKLDWKASGLPVMVSG